MDEKMNVKFGLTKGNVKRALEAKIENIKLVKKPRTKQEKLDARLKLIGSRHVGFTVFVRFCRDKHPRYKVFFKSVSNR